MTHTPPAIARRPDRPLVSVVLSFRNEAGNIPALVARLDKAFAGQNADYEAVFVNDASTDASLPLLMAERDRNWTSPAEAARLVDEPELQALLAKFKS